VVDRGEVYYAWFGRLAAQDVFIVTRVKDRAVFTAVEKSGVPKAGLAIRDDVIRLTGTRAQEDCPHLRRRIEYVSEETAGTLVFLTNHLDFAAATIAKICMERCQIELFFNALRQNLKIKTFVGTSAMSTGRRIPHNSKGIPPSRLRVVLPFCILWFSSSFSRVRLS